MSVGHHVSYFNNVQDGERKGTCSCGQTSGWLPRRQLVEDWETKHLENVQRALAHLRRSEPSMESQAAYYATMAELTDDEKEKATWLMLAHELEVRLGLFAPPSEQMELGFG